MHVLAIDLGTTSVKVSLFDDKTKVVCSVHERVKTNIGRGGIASQNASDWLEIIIRECREISEKKAEAIADIAGIAVTGHMMGCLPVDHSGNPLIGHMLHADNRARAEAKQIEDIIGKQQYYLMTGNILGPDSAASKMLWLRNNHPDLYDKTFCFLNAKDYVTGFLTGNYSYTDYSDASHAGLIDINSRSYSETFYNSIGIEIDKLPQLRAGTDQIGILSEKSAKLLGLKSGIPVMAGAGDGACSAIGSGAAVAGDTFCCMGTTAWIASVNDKPIFDARQRSFNIITADGKTVSSYGTTQNCGRSTDFAQKFFAVDNMKDFDDIAALAPAGADDLIFLPYLDGERSPIFDPDAQGVFFGLNSKHSREHGLRAVLEGVAYALKHNAEVHRENGLSIDRVRLIGGGGKSAIWRRILASVLPADIVRVDVPSADATSLGAAIVAATGIGFYDNIEQGISYIKEIETTEPEQEWQQEYVRLFNIYTSLYPALKPSFDQMIEK